MARSAVSGRVAVSNRQLLRDPGTCLYDAGAGWVFVSTSGTNLRSSVFTFAAWISPIAVTSGSRTIIGDAGGSGGRQFLINPNGTLQLNKENVAIMATSTGRIVNNVWSHVALTYDASGNYVFYINGVSAGSGTNLQTFTHGDLDICRQNSGEFFKGFIDEVQISNTVSSGQDISDLCYGIRGMLSSIQGYWKFDEGSGTTCADSSGNGRTGSSSSMVHSTNVFMKPRTITSGRVLA